MAITSGASPGIVVTSAAVNETIPAQTNVSDANTQVEVSDDISTLSNGNLETTPTYVGRLIILRQGLSNEETRYISAAAASGVGNTWLLTVSEPWVVNPVGSTDTIHVSYIIQDAATLTGLTLVNKTVQDYNSTRRFTVGSGGGTFAYMAFLNGVGLQMDDNGSTTVASFTVEDGGRFDCGYLQDGTPTGGCYMQGANGTNGELSFEVITNGEWNCFATFITGVQRELADFNVSTTSKIRFNGVRWSFIVNDVILGAQDTDLNNMAFLSDDTGTTPRIRVRDWATGDEVKNIVVNGFNGFESVTSGDDPVLRNTQFISMSKLLTVATAETWTFVNPIWNPATANQNDISIAGTGEVLEEFSMDISVADPTPTSLAAKTYVITDNDRGGGNAVKFDDIADGTGLSSATGEISFDIETRRFTDNAGSSLTVETTNGHALVVSEYGKLPIIRSVTLQNEDQSSQSKIFGQSESFSMLPDNFQVQTTASTAISTSEAKIAWENQTNPAVILKWTGGTGTLAVGDTIDTTNNGAQSTLVQILEGDSTAGTGLFNASNATAWVDIAQTLSDTPSAGDWSATYTVGSLVEFDVLIDCNDNATTGATIQELYDYMNAKLDEATLDTTPFDVRESMYWANGGTDVLPLVGVSTGSPNTFKTIRNVGDSVGVAIYNFTGGNGAIDRFTGNDGSEWIPATTVNVTVHCERKDTGANIQGIQVLVTRISDGTDVSPTGTTNASGDYSFSFEYTSDLNVRIDVRKGTSGDLYLADDGVNTITANGMAQTFLMRVDPYNSN